jgi:hypothetical protein
MHRPFVGRQDFCGDRLFYGTWYLGKKKRRGQYGWNLWEQLNARVRVGQSISGGPDMKPMEKATALIGRGLIARIYPSADVAFGPDLAIAEASCERHELPKRGTTNEDIGDAREGSVLAAKHRGNKVKFEQASQQPVESPNDDKQQGDDVQCVHLLLLGLSARQNTTHQRLFLFEIFCEGDRQQHARQADLFAEAAE